VAGSTEIPDRYARYVPDALRTVNVPAYIVGRDGLIRWINAAARETVGDVVGRRFTSVVDVDPKVAESILAHNLSTRGPHDRSITLVGPDGRRERVDLSAVPIGEEGHAVAMFGIAVPRKRERQRPSTPTPLTPRQLEVLHLLADGMSTAGIADHLVISEETVRNHVRHILTRLDARTRLEAVATGRRLGLV
jgi:DNA-binding CsgD family transcriptional regulator